MYSVGKETLLEPITIILFSVSSPSKSTMNWNGYTFLLIDSSTRIDDYSRIGGNRCKRRAFSPDITRVISRIFLMAPSSPISLPRITVDAVFFFLFTRIPVFANPLGFAAPTDFARRNTVSNRRCRCDNEADSVDS